MVEFASLVEVEVALRPYTARGRSGPYTLDKMRALMSYLGDPQDSLRVVHIAGTSGKTTTSYYIAKLLAATGQRVGLTVSPHIVDITERAQILGDDFDVERFLGQFSEYFTLIQTSDIEPSYFELMMAFALWLFAREKVDYAVIETGLGGLLDASNVCRRSDKICVITDIGYDHVNILGNTLGEIAAQKAGIIAPGNTVLMYEQSSEIMMVVRHAATQNNALIKELASTQNETFMKRTCKFFD